jgi:hypothetical protein
MPLWPLGLGQRKFCCGKLTYTKEWSSLSGFQQTVAALFSISQHVFSKHPSAGDANHLNSHPEVFRAAAWPMMPKYNSLGMNRFLRMGMG